MMGTFEMFLKGNIVDDNCPSDFYNINYLRSFLRGSYAGFSVFMESDIVERGAVVTVRDLRCKMSIRVSTEVRFLLPTEYGIF